MDRTKLILRWLLLLPAGIVGALIFFTVSQFVGSIVLDLIGINSQDFLYHVYRNSLPFFLQGALFIFIASTMAPHHRMLVSYVCLAILTVFGAAPLSIAIYSFGYESIDGWSIVGLIFELIGATLAVNAIRE